MPRFLLRGKGLSKNGHKEYRRISKNGRDPRKGDLGKRRAWEIFGRGKTVS